MKYLVVCNLECPTLSGRVDGWLGATSVNIELAVDADRHWRLNGASRPTVDGCVDLDLNFSPCTNLLPIRRLGLAIGQSAEVRAAWLRFHTFELEPLPQVYRRLNKLLYRYESGDGQFVADLQVNSTGFVTNYPGIWQAEANVRSAPVE